MKQCPQCGNIKSASDFYDHPYTADKKMGVCKTCHKKRMADARRDNPGVRERDRLRAKKPGRIADRNLNTSRWRADNPDAYKAQTTVSNALRDGKLVKEPCSICASESHIHAHHKDYAKPLDIVWLCARCHHRLHALFPELEGANKRATP